MKKLKLGSLLLRGFSGSRSQNKKKNERLGFFTGFSAPTRRTPRRKAVSPGKLSKFLGRSAPKNLSSVSTSSLLPSMPSATRKKKSSAQAEVPGGLQSAQVAAVHSVSSLPVLSAPVQLTTQTIPPHALPHTLATAELIRPGDRLRQSIEGFIMDQRSEHTKRAYGKDLKRFIKFLHARGLSQPNALERLDRGVLIAYKDALLVEGLEHTTIDRHLATLRSFFRWLVDDGHLDKNPAEGVRFLNPKRMSKTMGFSDLEVTRILKLPNLHTRTGAQHYAVLMVLFYCGLRRSELCSIRTSHLAVERGHHMMRLKGKGNAERIIVVTAPVWNALLHYFKITHRDPLKDQFLFSPIRNNRTGEKGKALDPSMIFYIVTRYAKEAGIMHRVSPHSCRATAISNARDHNVPDRAIQEFAGWASPDMITRYDKRKSSLEKSAAHSISYGSENRTLPWVKTEITLPMAPESHDSVPDVDQSRESSDAPALVPSKQEPELE
ncbi:MAG: tyrosine-type recombinase/integrase [Methylotenera sp.]|nr:tyrosine-type recombinase/integrase [Oligoflexia bacterium]